MVLLKSVIEIATRPMPDLPPELGTDRPGIGIVTIRCDPARCDASYCFGRSKECLGGSEVAVLAQHDVDQGTVTIDRAIQIPPLAADSDIRLVDEPAAAHSAFALAAQVLGQSRCELASH